MKNKIIFSAVIILIVAAAGFYIDVRQKENKIVSNANQQPAPAAENSPKPESKEPAKQYKPAISPKVSFQNYGKAPEFTGIYKWLNLPAGQAGDSLTMESLRGKVVLIDFWTYSCINCIRTLPYVTKWYDTYKNDGLVVVGVHTPEFAFEKDTGNVQDAIKHFGVHYPVAQDNDYKTWETYSNNYWPAEYLIDKNGTIVHEHFGEGEYDIAENAIRTLLGMNTEEMTVSKDNLAGIESPEMYFGTARLQNLVPVQAASVSGATYSLPAEIGLNTFALEGEWQFSSDNVKLVSGQGKIKLKFHSGKVHLVASSENEARLAITVDGKSQPPVTVKNSQLYTLFDSSDYSDHVIEISISTHGFEAFTFTFG